MSEGDLHKRLVQGLVTHVRQRRSGSWNLFLDSRNDSEYFASCPTLGSACPDLYAREHLVNHLVVGEAKTALDLENSHTEKQLIEYFSHLSKQNSSELIMAVPLMCVGAAHRLCRAARTKCLVEKVPFEITGWMFGATPKYEVWRG
jgi:hypothetical protein